MDGGNIVIVWEDPDEPEAPLRVTHPAPAFIELLRGTGMTEQQAVEFVLRKDVPARVWAQPHNRQMFAFTRESRLPDRSARNAWRLATLLDEAA